MFTNRKAAPPSFKTMAAAEHPCSLLSQIQDMEPLEDWYDAKVSMQGEHMALHALSQHKSLAA